MGAKNKVNSERWTNLLAAIGTRRHAGQSTVRLTESIVASARTHPLGMRYSLADGEVAGLCMLVGATGDSAFWLTYRTKAGARRQFKIGKAGSITLDDARRLARAALAKVEAGGDPAAEESAQRSASMTLRQYIVDIYEPRIMSTWAMATCWTAKYRIKSGWLAIEDSPLNQITAEQIESMLRTRREAKLADATVICHWAMLRGILRQAVKTGHLAAMPIEGTPEALRGLVRNKKVRYLGQRDTEQEIASGRGERARFMEALEAYQSPRQWGGDFIRTTVKVSLATGLRRSEVLRLNEKMIDWRKETITLPAHSTKAKRQRTVHLNADAIAALKAWPHRSIKGDLFPGSPFVLWGRITSLDMPQVCAMARVKDFSFHSCRHDFASRLAMAGVHPVAIMEALGHSQLSMSERYMHLAPSVTRDAVRSLSAG